MAVQKRIIWVDDKEWAAIRERAEAEGKTISVLLREAAQVYERLRSGAGFGHPRPAPKGK